MDQADDTRPVPPGLAPFWSGPVSAFAELSPNSFDDGQKERHRIYSLLLLAMLNRKWNGNKYGETGDYGQWRAEQQIGKTADGLNVYGGGSYQGHNIAALAVDAEGRIIDFDFNHNQVFDSTVEHAESRLVRRVFALNQVYDPWFALEGEGESAAALPARGLRPRQRRNVFATSASAEGAAHDAEALAPAAADPAAPTPYSTLLKDVTIYTSLESCAQCSGIMCLGSVETIVYLQWDQGQFLVGNMMWQATNTEQLGFTAPRPVRGDEFDFEYFTQLNAANDQFSQELAANPFYTGPGASRPVTTPSVTSFLCTDQARAIYANADTELQSYAAQLPSYAPPGDPPPMTNGQVVDQARDFLDWVTAIDNRGAPHRV